MTEEGEEETSEYRVNRTWTLQSKQAAALVDAIVLSLSMALFLLLIHSP